MYIETSQETQCQRAIGAAKVKERRLECTSKLHRPQNLDPRKKESEGVGVKVSKVQKLPYSTIYGMGTETLFKLELECKEIVSVDYEQVISAMIWLSTQWKPLDGNVARVCENKMQYLRSRKGGNDTLMHTYKTRIDPMRTNMTSSTRSSLNAI